MSEELLLKWALCQRDGTIEKPILALFCRRRCYCGALDNCGRTVPGGSRVVLGRWGGGWWNGMGWGGGAVAGHRDQRWASRSYPGLRTRATAWTMELRKWTRLVSLRSSETLNLTADGVSGLIDRLTLRFLSLFFLSFFFWPELHPSAAAEANKLF